MYSNIRMKLLLSVVCCLLPVFLTGCASVPSSYFRLKPLSSERSVKIAIIPFTNLTTEKDAEKKITYALITHLLSSNCLDVVDMGEVQKAIKDAKARKDEDLSAEDIKKIGEITQADALLMGVVEEYKIDSSTMLGEKVFVPEVSISMRLVSVKGGLIAWAANHHRRGDDHVTLFGMGRVDSISKLTDIIIKDTVNSLVKVIKSRRNAVAMLRQGRSMEIEDKPQHRLKEKAGNKASRTKAIQNALKEATKKQPSDEKEDIEAQAVSGTNIQIGGQAQKKEASQAIVYPDKEEAKQEPKDERREIKEKYQQEYEKIEQKYKQELG